MNRYDKLNRALLKEMNAKYPVQIKGVWDYRQCELEYDFLGFIEQYEALAKVIPKHYTVIDLGCYAGVQGWYFRDHKKYIGVDVSNVPRIHFGNTQHFTMTIDDFIDSNAYKKLDISTTFAICNYVPTDTKNLRESFKNLFVYYPAGMNVGGK